MQVLSVSESQPLVSQYLGLFPQMSYLIKKSDHSNWVVNGDLILGILQNYSVWTGISAILHPKEQFRPTVHPHVQRTKPVARPYKFFKDALRANAMQNALMIAGPSDYIKMGQKLERRYENEIIDAHLDGVAFAIPTDELGQSFSTESTISFRGRPLRISNIRWGVPFTSYIYSATGQPTVEHGVTTQLNIDAITTYEIARFLEELEGQTVTWIDESENFSWTFKYTNVYSTVSGTGVTLNYSVCQRTENRSTSGWHEVNAIHSLTFLNLRDPLIDGRRTYTSYVESWDGTSDPSLITSRDELHSPSVTSLYHGQSTKRDFTPIKVNDLDAEVWILRRAEGLSANYFSVADAIGKFFSQFKNNWVETLSELRGIVDTIPTSPLLLRAMGLLTNVTWQQNALDAVRLLAQLKLSYDFGFRPSEKAIREFVHGFSALYNEIMAGRGAEFVLRGKSLGTHTDQFGRTIEVVSRSKVHVRFPPSALLATLQGVDRAGVLPRISRLWETIPFSFLVDRYFAFDKKWAAHENVAMVALLDVKSYISTTLIKSYLQYEDLAASNLVEQYRCEAKRFTRRVSIFPPAFEIDDPVDYAIASGGVSVLTDASLAFSVLYAE